MRLDGASSWIGMFAFLLTACGGEPENQKVGTLVFVANGEDFVRDGFVSEDGWSISFDAVYANLNGATAFQVVEPIQQSMVLRHGGHPHEDIPQGAAHVGLEGEFFLQLKQDVFEVSRDEQAPIGNYNRLNFNILRASDSSQGVVAKHVGYSIVLEGSAAKNGNAVQFVIKFDEEMRYISCGPNGEVGVLAEGARTEAEMTFHFDHVFGDAEEGPADPADEQAVNHIAVGFQPFADLAEDTSLEIDQAALGEKMTGATFHQLIEALHTLGHSGEAHCHLDQ